MKLTTTDQNAAELGIKLVEKTTPNCVCNDEPEPPRPALIAHRPTFPADAQTLVTALYNPHDEDADFERLVEAMESGELALAVSAHPLAAKEAPQTIDTEDVSLLGGGARIIRRKPGPRLVVRGFQWQRIDGLEGHTTVDDLSRSTFMAFNWTLSGGTESVWPQTPVREALVIVVEGEVEFRSDGSDAPIQCRAGEAVWMCSGSPDHPRLPALTAHANGPARGIILLCSEFGVPLQFGALAEADDEPSVSPIVAKLALGCANDRDNAQWMHDLTPLHESGYAHHDAIAIGNIIVAEANDWRAAHVAREANRSRLLYRVVYLPARSTEADVSVAVHPGMELIFPLFGVTSCYFAPPHKDDGWLRLREHFAGKHEIGAVRHAVIGANEGERLDREILILQPREVFHGFRAGAGKPAGLLMFGVGRVEACAKWRAHCRVEDAQTQTA